MQLHYLDFEFSDEEDTGQGSFDAMASVLPERLPALLAEVAAVLDWATRTFGPPGEQGDDGEWDYATQRIDEPDAGANRTTVTLTVGGSAAFCRALRDAFPLGD